MTAALPPQPTTARRHPRLPHRDDVLIAVAGALGGLFLWTLGIFNSPAMAERYGTYNLLPLAVMCLAVLGRRTLQPWPLLVGLLALVGDTLSGSLLVTLMLFSDLVYSAVLYGSARLARAMMPATLAVTVATTVGALAALQNAYAVFLGLVTALVTTFPAGTGLLVRRHRDQAAAERLRAEQTALLAEMDRTQAVNAERARMARELHDVVAGHLSAIAVHSTAAQTLDDHAATHKALGVIRDNSVQGLAEMRRLIELLRTADADSDADAPGTVPTLAGLPELVERAGRSGAERRLRFVLDRGEHGEHAWPRPPRLPAPVELAAYRLVQESLTNALKHSGPGTVTVRLAREHFPAGTVPGGAGTDALTVSVSNPLGDEEAPRVPGTGTGLVGMRERTALLGGRFTAGPQGGRWQVRAVLPLAEGAAHR